MAASGAPGNHSLWPSSLVRAIHAASLDAAGWAEALDGLRRQLRAKVVTLGHHEFASGNASILSLAPGDAGFKADLAGYSARNPWFLSSSDYTRGRVMAGDDLLARHELLRTDFYRGFLEPRGLLHMLCGVVAHDEGGTHVVHAYRAHDDEAFGAADSVALEQVLEHFTIALHNRWRWEEADGLSRALLALIDRDPSPTLLVTADARPLHVNPAAELLLGACAGLQREGGHVVAASPGDRRLLRETLARLAGSDGTSQQQPAVLTLANSPPAPPMIAVVRSAGLVPLGHNGCQRGLALIALRGSQTAHDPSTCAFARQFDLTPAQARVSALMFAGQSLSAVAHQLNLSENTVRSHLKQIFSKTETHGQMELAHLHARICPTLP